MKITDYGLSFRDDDRVEKSIFNKDGLIGIYYNDSYIGCFRDDIIALEILPLIRNNLRLNIAGMTYKEAVYLLPKGYNLTDDDLGEIPESEQPRGLWFRERNSVERIKSLRECRKPEVYIYYDDIWIGSRHWYGLQIHRNNLKGLGLALKSTSSIVNDSIELPPDYLLTEADFEKITQESR